MERGNIDGKLGKALKKSFFALCKSLFPAVPGHFGSYQDHHQTQGKTSVLEAQTPSPKASSASRWGRKRLEGSAGQESFPLPRPGKGDLGARGFRGEIGAERTEAKAEAHLEKQHCYTSLGY